MAIEETPPPVSWEARAQHTTQLLNGLLLKIYELGALIGHERVIEQDADCTCGFKGQLGEPYSDHIIDQITQTLPAHPGTEQPEGNTP